MKALRYNVEAVRYDDSMNVTRAEVWAEDDHDTEARKGKHPVFASEADRPITDCRLWAESNGICNAIIYH